MRRLRILLAGMVAAGTLGAWTGVVAADRPTFGGFCDLYTETDEALRGLDVDPSDADAVAEAYADAADGYNDLADSAPKKLKKALKRVARYYDALSEVDFSDLEEATEAELDLYTPKVIRAIQKLADYVNAECL